MPRRNIGLLAVVAAAIIGASVLYVIRSSPVHERAPKALAELAFEAAPVPLRPATFLDAKGRAISLTDFKGRPVILNLWATWCAPCVRELPALGHLARALGQAGTTIVAVNAGRESAAQTADFLKRHGAGDLAVYRDPELSLFAAFGAQGLPFSVLIDARGREVAHVSGPVEWDDPGAVAYFRALAARN